MAPGNVLTYEENCLISRLNACFRTFRNIESPTIEIVGFFVLSTAAGWFSHDVDLRLDLYVA